MASKITLLFVTLFVFVVIDCGSSEEQYGTFNDPRLRTSPTTTSSDNKTPKPEEDIKKRPVRGATTQKLQPGEVTTEKRNKRSEKYDSSSEEDRVNEQVDSKPTSAPRSRRDATTSRTNEHPQLYQQQTTTQASNSRKVREATSTTARPNNGNFASPLLLRTNDKQIGNQQSTSTSKSP